ncbi:hypothetical protein D3C84_1006340 [compost metagenome]
MTKAPIKVSNGLRRFLGTGTPWLGPVFLFLSLIFISFLPNTKIGVAFYSTECGPSIALSDLIVAIIGRTRRSPRR